MTYCKHEDCRSHAIEELLWMYAKTHRADILDHAMRVRSDRPEVRCRHVPRDPRVPFATKGGQHG